MEAIVGGKSKGKQKMCVSKPCEQFVEFVLNNTTEDWMHLEEADALLKYVGLDVETWKEVLAHLGNKPFSYQQGVKWLPEIDACQLAHVLGDANIKVATRTMVSKL